MLSQLIHPETMEAPQISFPLVVEKLHQSPCFSRRNCASQTAEPSAVSFWFFTCDFVTLSGGASPDDDRDPENKSAL